MNISPLKPTFERGTQRNFWQSVRETEQGK
uniref:AraC family transcriptional regulator n=1 Tax=Haemonchus contortus TaxID=6289 RepID=A0A7I4YWP1_HAECO